MSSVSDLRKKKNQTKKQLQKIALLEGQNWRDLVRKAKPLREKFIEQWKKRNDGKANSFLKAASQYAVIASKEQKERITLDAKFRPYLEQLANLDCKIQKAKDRKN